MFLEDAMALYDSPHKEVEKYEQTFARNGKDEIVEVIKKSKPVAIKDDLDIMELDY